MLTKAHATDAGYDLISQHAAIITSNTVTAIHTGVYGDVPPGSVGLVCPRSGLAAKYGVTVVNAPGVVDSGYDGEIIVLLSKFGEEPYPVRKGDRVAQLLYIPMSAYDPGASSERGSAGFGSSGR